MDFEEPLMVEAKNRRRRLGSLALLLVPLFCPTAKAEPLPRFSGNPVWNQNISSAAVHPSSATMIGTLAGLGGFGFGRMQIDFSFHVVHAAEGAPTRTIVMHPDGYYSPDCESVGTAMPVPAGAAIEGETGLVCDNLNNDCHLLVVQGRTLYEAYSSTAQGGSQLQALCLAIWHLDLAYPETGRGDHCTSADAAGFPIAPLLWNADEIAASLAIDSTGNGDLGHAIRFILPNERMANDPSLGGVGGRLYVRPGTHAGGPSGPVGSVPYGARLRLRADFPLTGYNPAARVVLNTMKRFGIVLSDGGSVALTAESDLFTTTTWAELGIDARVFDLTPGAADVTIEDFAVLDTGPRIAETWNCVPNNLAPPVFADGFESGNTAQWSLSVP
jgi:serine/threonine-protein kinase